MKTCCPQCKTILTLNQQQVAKRNGMVRCGVCHQVFNALEHLYDDDYPILSQESETSVVSPASHFAQGGQRPTYEPPKTPDVRYDMPRRAIPSIRSEAGDDYDDMARSFRVRPAEEGEEVRREVHMTSSARDREKDYTISTPPRVEREVSREAPAVHIHLNNGTQHTIREDRDFDEDHYIGRRREDGRRDDDFVIRGDAYDADEMEYEERSSFGWFWLFIILLALGLIAGQLLYVFRNQISTAYPSMRPMLVQMCSLLKCEVDIQKSVNNLALENVVLSLNDKVAPKQGEQALRLQALLVNKTEKPQDWPVLVLRLKNAQGVVVNSKNIQPKEYLVPEQLMQPFAGNAKQVINLPFVLDGAPISGYELSIFYP